MQINHAVRVLSVLLFLILGGGVAYANEPAGDPLTVVVGCGDGQSAAKLYREGHIVQGLDTDVDHVAKARQHFQQRGISGSVTAAQFDGVNLPYGDDMVNCVIVAGEYPKLTEREVLRVLAPNGTAVIRGRTLSKPYPSSMDQWTHYLHGADGNPVAEDDLVKPPRQLRWVADPAWQRQHDHMASVSALVSANGRVFFICDEGPLASILYPPKWNLVARDAYNGLLLWRRPIQKWFNHLQKLKSGPASLPRRLVAVGDRVYVTLGIGNPVSCIDAATGETIREYAGTEGTEEIVYFEGVLFLVRGTGGGDGNCVTAVDAEKGTVLWEKQQPVASLTLAVNDRLVAWYTGSQVVATDRISGLRRWSSDIPGKAKAAWNSKSTPRMLLTDDVVVLASFSKLFALSIKDGKRLWDRSNPKSGYASPPDLLCIDGLIWVGELTLAKQSGVLMGIDPVSGEVKNSFAPDKDYVWLSHHRCHFSKGTKNYYLPSRMGVEFVDIKHQSWLAHHWTRGGCIYGIMPCNGLLYAPAHSCACYFEAKLNGFSALTSSTYKIDRSSSKAARLEKGPAYGESLAKSEPGSEDWPTFRHDAARSGSTGTAVGGKLVTRWSTDLGGKLSQAVCANGQVFVASVDHHTLYALDAESGEVQWSFITGARVDSPPTIYQGMALFGCRDGWVYCLRVSDGRLRWRFRGVPYELQLMVYGQLESAWPLHGSVLIDNDELHCVAGRSMFLDGGLRYLRLNPQTGELISETLMDDSDPIEGGSIQKYDTWVDMTTTLPDVLSADGKSIYMRSLPFDKKGIRRRISHVPDDGEVAHLFSPTGFLDGNWFHRSYWTYARSFPGGWNGHCVAGRYNPAGRIMVVDGDTIYAYARKIEYYRWTTPLEYRLYAVNKDVYSRENIYGWDVYKEKITKKYPDKSFRFDRKTPGASAKQPFVLTWEDSAFPIFAKGMVATGKHLFVGGPRDIVDEGIASRGSLLYQKSHDGLMRQSEVWAGREGGVLVAVSKKDGGIVTEQPLDSLPVFDGIIASGGRLYISLENGKLICME